MADFISALNGLLGGDPSGLTSMLGNQPQSPGAPPSVGMNYGAAPTAQGIGGQVLARLSVNGPGGSMLRQPAQPGPLGQTAPWLGNDTAAALGGMSAVDPTASKFGALAQGFAGGMVARRNAEIQDQELAARQQAAGLEQLKTRIAIQQQAAALADHANAQNLLSRIAGGPPQSAPQGSDSSTAQGADQTAAQPPGLAAVQRIATAQPGPTPQASPVPQTAPGSPPASAGDASAAPTDNTGAAPRPIPHGMAKSPDFWAGVDDEWNPAIISARAQTYRQLAATQFMPDNQKLYAGMADAADKRLADINANGRVLMRDNSQAFIPGFLQGDYAKERITNAARVAAENAGKAVVNPDGSSYVPAEQLPNFAALTAGMGGQAATPQPGGPAPSGGGVSPAPGAGVSMPPSAAAAPPGVAPPAGAGMPGAAPPKTIGATPTAAMIDPQSAKVTSSIPIAPPGGGFPMPNVPPGAKLVGNSDLDKETAKADAGFDDLIGKAPTVDQSIERLQAAGQALKLFQSGSGAERLNAGAALAQSFGFPDIAQKIQGGDPAALQWLSKEGVNLTLSTLSAAQPRFAQAEFKALAANGMPDPNKLPQANHQVISEMLGSAMRSKAFMQDWQVANKNGWTSPSAFYTAWSAANPLNTFTAAAQRQLGNFKGMQPPDPSDYTAGVVYAAPSNMPASTAAAFAKRGIQPGQLYRYNGKNAPNPIEAIPPSQNFSAHLNGGQ